MIERSDDAVIERTANAVPNPVPDAMKNVLVLGGTRDAVDIATMLVAETKRYAGARVITSLAGRTARPAVPPGEVRIGGFGGVDGLLAYLERERIDAVLDATHPFAARISANAVLACARACVPLVAFERPAWRESAGDRWHRVADAAAAATRARDLGTRIFLTVGRQELAAFASLADRFVLVRAIDAPEAPLPGHHEIVLARGPFRYDDELALMRARAIDVVVAKDSGGDATSAKLVAARTLGIPVVVIDRPKRSGATTVASVADAAAWLHALGFAAASAR